MLHFAGMLSMMCIGSSVSLRRDEQNVGRTPFQALFIKLRSLSIALFVKSPATTQVWLFSRVSAPCRWIPSSFNQRCWRFAGRRWSLSKALLVLTTYEWPRNWPRCPGLCASLGGKWWRTTCSKERSTSWRKTVRRARCVFSYHVSLIFLVWDSLHGWPGQFTRVRS